MKGKALMGEAVAVWWLDAHSVEGSLDIKDAKKEKGMFMLSVGVLIDDTDSDVKLAQDYYETEGEEARLRDLMVIPKAYITKMRKWKV